MLVSSGTQVLGDTLPSSDPVFLGFLGFHVVAGLTAVVSGAGAALIRRKGRGPHTRFGDVYFAALCIVFVTAVGMGVLRWAQDYRLVLIGSVAAALGWVGFLARKRHWPGDTAHIVGMGGSYVALLTAFYVDNGPRLPLWDRLPVIAFWVLPAIIGTPLIWRAAHRRRAMARTAVP